MKRRTVLQAALAGTAALALPLASRAQTPRKLSYLTWNIADQEQLFKEEFADFRSADPGVEIEWLDKKGTELPAFYQTLLYYNKTIFKEAGLSGPPQSFDELLSFAQKMAKGEKTGFLTLNFDWLYWPLFKMNGIEL